MLRGKHRSSIPYGGVATFCAAGVVRNPVLIEIKYNHQISPESTAAITSRRVAIVAGRITLLHNIAEAVTLPSSIMSMPADGISCLLHHKTTTRAIIGKNGISVNYTDACMSTRVVNRQSGMLTQIKISRGYHLPQTLSAIERRARASQSKHEKCAHSLNTRIWYVQYRSACLRSSAFTIWQSKYANNRLPNQSTMTNLTLRALKHCSNFGVGTGII